MDALRILDWDTGFFGVRIGALASGLDASAFAAALEKARADGVACLYLRCEADDLATLRLAETHRFRVVDVRLTYRAKLDARPVRGASPSASVRDARAEDVPVLRAIAAASHKVSRFYADGRFDPGRCDELYATWIEKSCNGFAELVLVAEHAGRPAGYLSCHRRDERQGEIGLLGVDARARGQGLGRALVESALAWFAREGLNDVSVVTQGRSLEAQRLYQSAGFRSSKVELWHHLWLRDGERT